MENAPVEKPGPTPGREPPAGGGLASAWRGEVGEPASHLWVRCPCFLLLGGSGVMIFGSIVNRVVSWQSRYNARPQGRRLFHSGRPEAWFGRQVRKVGGLIFLS